MKIDLVKIVGFRGLVKEEFTLKDLTVCQGEMGIGKTSKLLSILYGLTGSILPALNLDDLIHVDSEFMWVQVTGGHEGRLFTIERRKRRGQPTSVKTDLPSIPRLSERVFIEGREISKLFAGAPSEKILKIDALLGLSEYNQLASEISIVPVERRIDELLQLKSTVQQSIDIAGKLARLEEQLTQINSQLQHIHQQLEEGAERFTWAEQMQPKLDRSRRASGEIQSKRNFIDNYNLQLSSLPPYSSAVEEELREFEARYDALQRRVTFLEAAIQTLDLAGKKIEEVKLCPLCGALMSTDTLERFRHYDEEYKEMISRSAELEVALTDVKGRYERMKKDREKGEFLRGEIDRLQKEVAEVSVDMLSPEEVGEVETLLKSRDALMQQKKELEIRRSSLEGEKKVYESIYTEAQQTTVQEVEEKVQRLTILRDQLKKIKEALIEALKEVRGEQLNSLRASFKEAFKTIYPYKRFTDVDFEMIPVRGRETLMVKAKTDGDWIYSHQMSTGENVAVSFALLSAINQIENAPILLLDEPEEGLDENGVKGLADVLHNLKTKTQIVVATRSQQLAQLLQSRTPGEASAG